MSKISDELIDIVLDLELDDKFVGRSFSNRLERIGRRNASARELRAYIVALESENAVLKDAFRWIPIAEKLPDEKVPVPVLDNTMSPPRYSISALERWKVLEMYGMCITHWFSMPAAPDKVDGKYLPEISGKAPVWNWRIEDWRKNIR